MAQVAVNTDAANSSGFTTLPGGYRSSSGSFHNLGYRGYWWSSNASSGLDAWGRHLYYDNGKVGRYYGYKTYGFSARCLKN